MRYRVLDLPIKGLGAFTPLPGRNPIASSWALVRTTAQLGRLPISSPHPAATPDISFDPKTTPSNVAPDVITRDCYITYADNMGPSADAGFGMATRRLTPLPVPALSWIATAKKAMITP